MMRAVLVTGAGGFVGRCLVGALRESGYSVRKLVSRDKGTASKDGEDVIYGDIRDASVVRRAAAGIDTVFHLAAKVHDTTNLEDQAEHDEITVRGTRNLVNALSAKGVRSLVFLSSLSVFSGNVRERLDETASCFPKSAYGLAKLQAERIVLEEGIKARIHVCCLRPAMIYGPGCKGNLPRMLQMIDRGLFPPFPKVANRRSMVHVSDVVEAAIRAADHPAANGQCYIITDGRAYSTRELYELIARGLGKRVPRWSVPLSALRVAARVGDVAGRLRGRRMAFDSDAFEKLTGDAWYSSEKIAKELGFQPHMTFEDALPDMIASYRSQAAPPTC